MSGFGPAVWGASGGGGGTVLFSEVASEAASSFDTGTLDLTPYSRVEIFFTGRSDNNAIYDEARLQFNGDTTIANYSHAAQGSNPTSTSSPGGFFSANWDGDIYFGGSDVGDVATAGILMGYAAGATADSGFVARVRGTLLDPGEASLPQSGDFTTHYIDTADGGGTNGPEIITLAGFWTPAPAAAITQITVVPGLGTEFNTGSKFKVVGFV